MKPFKKGMIILWSGSLVTIPKGWGLCNGSNGTPDLRNRFVVCAGDTYDPTDIGGSITHRHAENATHTHNLEAGKLVASGTGYREGTSGPVVPGYTFYSSTLPFYYALAYIMKL